MTEIMPFPENNFKTVLLDRPERGGLFIWRRREPFGSRILLWEQHRHSERMAMSFLYEPRLLPADDGLIAFPLNG